MQVLYLSAVGGDDVKESIRLIMRRLLRRSVSLKFSFMGKRSFGDLKVCKAVFGETHKCVLVRLFNFYSLLLV